MRSRCGCSLGRSANHRSIRSRLENVGSPDELYRGSDGGSNEKRHQPHDSIAQRRSGAARVLGPQKFKRFLSPSQGEHTLPAVHRDSENAGADALLYCVNMPVHDGTLDEESRASAHLGENNTNYVGCLPTRKRACHRASGARRNWVLASLRYYIMLGDRCQPISLVIERTMTCEMHYMLEVRRTSRRSADPCPTSRKFPPPTSGYGSLRTYLPESRRLPIDAAEFGAPADLPARHPTYTSWFLGIHNYPFSFWRGRGLDSPILAKPAESGRFAIAAPSRRNWRSNIVTANGPMMSDNPEGHPGEEEILRTLLQDAPVAARKLRHAHHPHPFSPP
ncbi:hypothetical protein VTK26DRAFT_1689 [Humicola hyalothermophila]